MSINPIGGAGPVQGHSPIAPAAKAESGEAPGAPEHDGDADDAAHAAPVKGGGPTLPGTLNVKA